MIKIFYAVAVSAIAAACFVALPTLSLPIDARPPVTMLVQPHDVRLVSADRVVNSTPR
ncbi:MAG: hypothetical protein WBE48_22660 [Xanthobacteraceae bacterium]